eukprot:CAMPEP_0197594896 /NCGR_PEP_ID=MMETSP1326-20131121/21664_1 /TAXON_ID=1155430 /ORGANISM="Genus nov. species nov., Strain RCC2288" /LENGTH=62 /DNA_ID=CAMNT_0043161159 /DNA_START=17 /DNA_END=201 /DNA_ORIENTATION=+
MSADVMASPPQASPTLGASQGPAPRKKILVRKVVKPSSDKSSSSFGGMDTVAPPTTTHFQQR